MPETDGQPVSRNPFVRRPGLSVFLCLLLFIPLAWLASGFRFALDIESLLEVDQGTLKTYERVKEILPQVEVMVIIVETDDYFTRENMAMTRELSERLEAHEGVKDVKSFTHSTRPVRRGLSLQFEPFIPDGEIDEETLREVREFSLTHPLTRNILTDATGSRGIISVTWYPEYFEPEIRAAFPEVVREILAPYKREDVDFIVGALPIVQEEVRRSIYRTLLLFVPLAALAVGGVFYWAFRSWRLVCMVLLCELFYLPCLPGLFSLLGIEVRAFMATLFPLLAAIQLTLFAHVGSGFLRFRREGLGPKEAAEAMSKQILFSCALASLTTIAGLLALATCPITQVRDFGLLGAAGVAFAFLFTFGPVLSALVLAFGKAPNVSKSASLESFPPERWDGISKGLLHNRVKINKYARIIGVLCLPGVFLIDTDVRAVDFLPRGSESLRFATTLESELGGLYFSQITLEAQEDAVEDPKFLRYLADVQDYAESQPEINSAYSHALLYEMMNQTWQGGDPEALELPGPLLMKFFAQLIELNKDILPFLELLTSPDGSVTNIIVRTNDMETERFLAAIAKIQQYAEENAPEGVSVSAALGTNTLLEADQRVQQGQLFSGLTTIGAIFLLLLVLWRSWKHALIALSATLLPILLAMGIAGYFGAELNSVTIMVTALAIGIAIDDAVHIITFWRKAGDKAGSLQERLSHTAQVKGPPVVTTSIVLVMIFFMFVLTEFPPVRQFGMLAALAFALTLAFIVFLLPSMLSFLAWKRPRTEEKAS